MQKLDYYLDSNGNRKILKELEDVVFNGNDHRDAAVELVDRLYPNLRAVLMAKYPQMTDSNVVSFYSKVSSYRARRKLPSSGLAPAYLTRFVAKCVV